MGSRKDSQFVRFKHSIRVSQIKEGGIVGEPSMNVDSEEFIHTNRRKTL
jgi:hypothetical protein